MEPVLKERKRIPAPPLRKFRTGEPVESGIYNRVKPEPTS
jgi:hypothetical protein